MRRIVQASDGLYITSWLRYSTFYRHHISFIFHIFKPLTKLYFWNACYMSCINITLTNRKVTWLWKVHIAELVKQFLVVFSRKTDRSYLGNFESSCGSKRYFSKTHSNNIFLYITCCQIRLFIQISLTKFSDVILISLV